MNNKAKISVIVPIYNVEQYLHKCIDSIVNQTYHNLEIILVDDGSPDQCGKICDEYAEKDSRIIVIHKPNGGLSEARNAGLNIAKGDYILFVDSDDWLETNACESVINFAKDHNADIVTFGVIFVQDGKKTYSHFGLKGKVSPSDCIKGMVYQIHENGIYNYAVNKLYSKVLFKSIRYEKGKLAEDQGTTYKLFHNAHNIWVCEMNLYNYFQRDNSISRVQFNSKLMADRIELWIERLAFIEKYYPEIVNYQIAQILGDVYVGLIKLKDKDGYSDVYYKISNFANKYKFKEKQCVKYNKKVKLHYYCYPLFWIYFKFLI